MRGEFGAGQQWIDKQKLGRKLLAGRDHVCSEHRGLSQHLAWGRVYGICSTNEWMVIFTIRTQVHWLELPVAVLISFCLSNKSLQT